MLKGFTIWNRLTLVPKKVILLVLFMLEIPLSISFFHRRYASFLDANSWITEGWQLLLFGICVFYFAGMLFRLAQKVMEEFSLIAYWTSLSESGCNTYVLCELIPWMELGLAFALTFGNYNMVHPFIIIVGVISVDMVCIRLGVVYTRVKRVGRSIQKPLGMKKVHHINSPMLRLMNTAFKQRLRCHDVTVSTVLVMVIYIALCGVVTGKALFVMAVLFMMFLYVLQDRVFESEGISLTYYKSIGIPLKKYLFVQMCSSVVFSQIPVFIVLAICGHSILQMGLFVLLMVAFSFYWNVLFLYNEMWNRDKRMVKFWIEIISLWMSIIPIINVLWIYTRYQRLQSCFQGP